MDVDAATRSMIDNMPAKTGRSLEEWFVVLDAHPYEKHGQGIALLKSEFGMSHGFANLVVARHRERGSAPATGDDLVDSQYAGAKAELRPIYERIIAAVAAFGDDVEIAPKKTGVSLRRRKQFALVEAPSATRVQLGLNLRGVAPTDRLREAGGMCTHRVDVRGAAEVDDELIGWLRDAYALA
jgi:hypothetical protein